MEKDTKRRWVFKTKRLCVFKEKVIDENDHSACIICRCKFDHYCVDCKKSINENLDQNITTIDQISMVLLCMKNRKDCLFYKLDIHMLNKILQYVLYPEKLQRKCRLVILECGHVYHRHCWIKFVKKGHCLYDDTEQVIPIEIQDVKRYNIKYDIISITTVPRNSVFVNEKEEKDKITSWIVRELKHHKPGYNFSDLHEKIISEKQYDIPKKLFKECVEISIQREFIKRLENNHKHLEYIP